MQQRTSIAPNAAARCTLPARFRCIVIDLERYHHGERGADALFTFQADGAAHALHQLFHDGKAQARPRVRAGSRLRLLRERLERVLLELGAHADARVGARDLERGHVVGGGKLAARDGQEHAGEQRVVRPVVGGYFAHGDAMGRSGVFDKHHQ